MSNFKVSNPKRSNPPIPNITKDACLSVRTGKMSFIQYGFVQDPGVGVEGKFDGNRVVLLVLNNHKNVQYEIVSESGTHTLGSGQVRDEVCILWPKNLGVPPKELSPGYLFEHSEYDIRGKKESRKWPRELFKSEQAPLEWDAALVYLDPTGNYAYRYHTGPDKCTDDYRFSLESQEIVAWLWKADAKEPVRLLPEGETVTRAMQAKSGGPQGEGGALPYPPG